MNEDIISKINSDMMKKMGITPEMIRPTQKHHLTLILSLDDLAKVVEFCRTNNIGIKEFGNVGT